jgi:hypothetical protein
MQFSTEACHYIATDVEPHDFSLADLRLPGDFYCGRDDTTRGVQFGGADVLAGDFLEPDLLLGLERSSLHGGKASSFEDVASTGSSERFTSLNAPPAVPSDSYFQLATTSLRLGMPAKDMSPHMVGNSILAFFNEACTAQLLKVRPSKFWVKANVFVEGRLCVVKARVYSEGLGVYALELQRRSGCSLVFNTIYSQAVDFFRQEGYVLHDRPAFPLEVAGSDNARAMPVPWLPEAAAFAGLCLDPCAALASKASKAGGAANSDLQEVQTLVDTMNLLDFPSLQAEATNALADIAWASPDSLKPCVPVVLDSIRYQCDQSLRYDPEVDFALGRLARGLCSSPTVKAEFEKANIVAFLEGKLCDDISSSVGKLVKTELAFATEEVPRDMRMLV